MNSLPDPCQPEATPDDAVLAREAGVPFQPPPSRDPIAEWMDLMEAVQALCPVWPVRTQPMRGNHWRL
jgi:hypothetical protein